MSTKETTKTIDSPLRFIGTPLKSYSVTATPYFNDYGAHMTDDPLRQSRELGFFVTALAEDDVTAHRYEVRITLSSDGTPSEVQIIPDLTKP